MAFRKGARAVALVLATILIGFGLLSVLMIADRERTANAATAIGFVAALGCAVTICWVWGLALLDSPWYHRRGRRLLRYATMGLGLVTGAALALAAPASLPVAVITLAAGAATALVPRSASRVA